MNKEGNTKIVGLKYTKGEGLPKVIVKGSGKRAEEILSARGSEGPIVVKDKKLAEQLYRLPIDAEIGRDLFELVAILLVHVYSLDSRLKHRKREEG